MADKPLHWVGSALDDLRQFPDEARRSAGYELRQADIDLGSARLREVLRRRKTR
jgi:phage-related protein